MTDNDKPASRSRPVETTEGAMDEYRARQKAERANMAKLKAMRLTAEAKAAREPRAKKKLGGKVKHPPRSRADGCRA
jgi:cell division protein FtsB